ncbi:MAG: TIGR00730 family Rossman fold protein [Thermoguttaceae bacterium]|nr:TIGR00730 family Rossman fold protein [Planctomycetaceae bacterium]MBQ4143909.1 TIGR00730 family Rossman fold protein [Thermoguttaceae bacterium]
MCAKSSKTPDILDLKCSSSYTLAYCDPDLMAQPELRPVRLMMEALKPEMALDRENIDSTIVVFGSARITDPEKAKQKLEAAQMLLEEKPKDTRRQKRVRRLEKLLELSKYYVMAREFARLVSEECKKDLRKKYVIITGGGPGIMEAANRGAFDAGAPSIGLNIDLPAEQEPNPYISQEFCFHFNYFAIRKMNFLLRAKALVAFPGGLGTLDELFEALTLRQTGKMQHIPIILFGKRDFWDNIINLEWMVDAGVIAEEDLDLFYVAETPAQAWEYIKRYHALNDSPKKNEE